MLSEPGGSPCATPNDKKDQKTTTDTTGVTESTDRNKEMDWKRVKRERRKERVEGFERQTMYKHCKIDSTLDSRGEMRKGDEFGGERSERSGLRERKKERVRRKEGVGSRRGRLLELAR